MKVRRQLNQRTYQRFKKMSGAALLIIGVQFFSEKSMDSIIEVASDSSNTEYDFSLPFVTAVQEVYDGEDFNKTGVVWYS